MKWRLSTGILLYSLISEDDCQESGYGRERLIAPTVGGGGRRVPQLSILPVGGPQQEFPVRTSEFGELAL